MKLLPLYRLAIHVDVPLLRVVDVRVEGILHPLILVLRASTGGSEDRISEIVENLLIEKVEPSASGRPSR